jgi:hypothetical protein
MCEPVKQEHWSVVTAQNNRISYRVTCSTFQIIFITLLARSFQSSQNKVHDVNSATREKSVHCVRYFTAFATKFRGELVIIDLDYPVLG